MIHRSIFSLVLSLLFYSSGLFASYFDGHKSAKDNFSNRIIKKEIKKSKCDLIHTIDGDIYLGKQVRLKGDSIQYKRCNTKEKVLIRKNKIKFIEYKSGRRRYFAKENEVLEAWKNNEDIYEYLNWKRARNISILLGYFLWFFGILIAVIVFPKFWKAAIAGAIKGIGFSIITFILAILFILSRWI